MILPAGGALLVLAWPAKQHAPPRRAASSVLDLRPVFFICGILIAALGGIMIIPAIVDAASGEPEWKAFALSALICCWFTSWSRLDESRTTSSSPFFTVLPSSTTLTMVLMPSSRQ